MNNEQTLTDTASAVFSVDNAVLNTADNEDDSFSFDGFQVVRSEFFAHINEPSISFSNYKVFINSACLRKLPTVEYIQFLVNPKTHKLVLRPCTEDAKDSFLWCLSNDEKRKPRQITCRMFFAKLVSLMEWNPNFRYKIVGKTIRCGEDHLILFDLSSTETYQRSTKDSEKSKSARSTAFPAEWKNQFGLPVAEHNKLLQVNIFDGYTVFGLMDDKIESEGGKQV